MTHETEIRKALEELYQACMTDARPAEMCGPTKTTALRRAETALNETTHGRKIVDAFSSIQRPPG